MRCQAHCVVFRFSVDLRPTNFRCGFSSRWSIKDFSLGITVVAGASERRYPNAVSMRVETASIVVPTDGKGTYEITDRIAAAVRRSGVTRGVATVFVRHTSCSLILMENADPTAQRDLRQAMAQTSVRRGNRVFGTRKRRKIVLT